MNEKSAVEDIYLCIKSKVNRQWVIAFVSCFIIGLLTYGYLMTNHFLTYDSMWNLYSDQDMITSGRQFLTYACAFSSYYDFPFLNGILAILYLAVTSVLLVELFQIKNGISGVLISGLLVTFPSVISTFCYTFTVDGYMLAVLLVTAALLITERRKFGFIWGAVLLGISLGIYQAYLAFLMVLCVIMLLLQILDERNVKKIVIQLGRYAGMGVGGYAFYLITLNMMLKLKGQTLSGYQGSDKVNSFSLSTLPAGLKTAFQSFIDFARWGNVFTTTEVMKAVFVVLMLAGAGMYAYLFLIKKCYTKPWKILLGALLTISIPICATIINVLSPDTYYHLLMRGAWCLLFIFVVVLAEKMSPYQKMWEGRIKRAVAAIVFVSSAVLIFEFTKMANVVGFNMEERYEKNYALTLRIVESLEETPGYHHGMKVAILGGEPNDSIFPSTEITTTDLVGYFGVQGDYSLNSTEKFAVFMKHYMNVTIEVIGYEEEIALTQSGEFLEMPYFPYSGCIRQIGDVWVVKLNG